MPDAERPKWKGAVEAHPMESSRAKLVRAFQQTQFLVRQSEAYAGSEPIRLDVRYDEERQGHVVYMEGRPPPLYLGLILGEVIHDLRSGLDHLAWQLALEQVGPEALAEPGVANLIAFPITSTKDRFEKHRALPYFGELAVAQMEALQPYHNEGSTLVNPLAALQELSNADKHRALRPALNQIRFDDLQFRSTVAIDIAGIEALAPEGSILLAGQPFMLVPAPRDALIEFAPVPVHICFYTEVTGQRDVMFLDKLDGLCEHISEAINVFGVLFPDVDYTVRRDSWFAPELGA